MRWRWRVVRSETERVSVLSTYSGSSGSWLGGRGVEVPVRRGVDVPETLGVAGAVGTRGIIVVMLNDTSPAAVATGFAEYLALSISIELYLQSIQIPHRNTTSDQANPGTTSVYLAHFSPAVPWPARHDTPRPHYNSRSRGSVAHRLHWQDTRADRLWR